MQYNFDKTIVDSGTTNLRLPDKVFKKVVALIQKNTHVSTRGGGVTLSLKKRKNPFNFRENWTSLSFTADLLWCDCFEACAVCVCS